MRKYTHIDKYLNVLSDDIYPQPVDNGHSALAKEAVETFMSIIGRVDSVLDAGCGEAFCQTYFKEHCNYYLGICLGEDYQSAKRLGRNVDLCDYTFTPYRNNRFSLLFSRHSLEHSPVPLLTLMEWYRISNKVALVLPSVEHWRYGGRNHYFMLNRHQWKVLFDAAGWRVTYENVKRFHMAIEEEKPDVAIEYWFILEKKV